MRCLVLLLRKYPFEFRLAGFSSATTMTAQSWHKLTKLTNMFEDSRRQCVRAITSIAVELQKKVIKLVLRNLCSFHLFSSVSSFVVTRQSCDTSRFAQIDLASFCIVV
jgi:hypothetical protein